MRPILLTRATSDRTPVYVNPDRIIFFEGDPDGGTAIDFGHESISLWVRETPEEILELLPSYTRRAAIP